MTERRSGFTLIELSIVLVIIGLLVGGIVVGQDMIQNATVRSEIKQYEEFSSAANTFRLKFGCLPGDCPNATQFFSAIPTVYLANGNGDGIINPSVPGVIYDSYADESGQFFAHLYYAGLIHFAPVSTPLGVSIAYLPLSKIQGSITIYTNAWNGNGFNGRFATADGFTYFLTGGQPYPPDVLHYHAIPPSSTVWSASQAKQVDDKIDDGLPLTGSVRAACQDFASSGNICILYPAVYVYGIRHPIKPA